MPPKYGKHILQAVSWRVVSLQLEIQHSVALHGPGFPLRGVVFRFPLRSKGNKTQRLSKPATPSATSILDKKLKVWYNGSIGEEIPNNNRERRGTADEGKERY